MWRVGLIALLGLSGCYHGLHLGAVSQGVESRGSTNTELHVVTIEAGDVGPSGRGLSVGAQLLTVTGLKETGPYPPVNEVPDAVSGPIRRVSWFRIAPRLHLFSKWRRMHIVGGASAGNPGASARIGPEYPVLGAGLVLNIDPLAYVLYDTGRTGSCGFGGCSTETTAVDDRQVEVAAYGFTMVVVERPRKAIAGVGLEVQVGIGYGENLQTYGFARVKLLLGARRRNTR